MADRTITARLRLVHAEYTKGAREASKATKGLGDEGEKAGKRTSDSWTKLGQATADLGDRLSTRLTLPILAVGGAAVKMANDFGNVFTQMEATAGVASSEVEGLKSEVLDLAGETGRAPKELAEALLLIRSSGFSGAEAMQVLETSARGAAAGMGTTREIANALTNVISGYGAANITAAEAMDILTASVTEGKAEAAEMAPQFGRLVPIAAELGIEFSELAGVMAFLTKPTGDAALSATQLSGVLAKMLEPGVEGAAALEAVGMSADDLRASIREKGLHQTLLDLRENLKANGMKLNDFAVDQQFLQGALLLTGASAEDAAEIIDNVGDSAGAADEAFQKWGDSLGAKNSKAWAQAQAAMVRFGDVALPMVASIAEFVGNLISMFADLPEGVQQWILVFAGLLAALGPVLSVGGNLTKVWQGLTSMIGGSVGSFAGTTLAAGGLALALGAVFFALNAMVQKKAEAEQRIRNFADALEQGGEKGRIAAEELLATGLTAGGLGEKLLDAGADLEAFIDDMRNGADQAEDLEETLRRNLGAGHIRFDEGDFGWAKALNEAADAGDEFAMKIREIAEAENLTGTEVLDLLHRMQEISGEYEEGAEKAKNNAAAQEVVADAAAEAGFAIDEQGNIVDATALKIEQLTSALDDLLNRYLSVDESVRRQNELVLGLGEHFDEMTEKYKNNALQLNNHTAAGIANRDMLDELFEATANTTQAMIENGESSEDIRAQWAQDRGELSLVIEKFRAAGQDVSTYDELLGAIDEMVRTEVTTPGMSQSQVRAAIYRATIDAIPWSRNTRITTSGTQFAVGQLDAVAQAINRVSARGNVHVSVGGGGGFILHDGGIVPGPRGREIAGVLLGGEEVLDYDDPRHSANLRRPDLGALSAPMVSGGAVGGSGVTNIFVNMGNGVFVGNERQFQRAVQQAFNNARRTRPGLAA